MTTTRPLLALALALVVTVLVSVPAFAGFPIPTPPAIPPGSADALSVLLAVPPPPPGGSVVPLFFGAFPDPIETIISPSLPAIGIPPGIFTAFLTEPGTNLISDQIVVSSDGQTFIVSLFSDPLVPITPCPTTSASCVVENGTFQLMNAALGLPTGGPIFIFSFSDIDGRGGEGVPGVTPLALVGLGLSGLAIARAWRRR